MNPSAQHSRIAVVEGPRGAEQHQLPALLRTGVDTQSLSLVIGLLVETGEAVGSKLRLHLLLGFFLAQNLPAWCHQVFLQRLMTGRGQCVLHPCNPPLIIQSHQKMMFSSLAGEDSRLYFVQWLFPSVFCPVPVVLCLAEKPVLPGLAAPTFLLLQKAVSSRESKWEDGFYFIPF